jgi:hypothetical protein
MRRARVVVCFAAWGRAFGGRVQGKGLSHPARAPRSMEVSGPDTARRTGALAAQANLSGVAARGQMRPELTGPKRRPALAARAATSAQLADASEKGV